LKASICHEATMPSEAKTLFLAALERPTEAERAEFLDAACGDAALRRRVEALLRAHAGADPFLDRSAADHLAGEDALPLDFLDRSDRPDALGRLGHYDVLESVGQGGMGIVLRAFDAKLHRVVAIKVLAPLLASHAPTRKRFLREARAAAAVVHEHVVAIHAVEDTAQVPYIVMQFVQGCTLQDKIDRTGPLPLTEILRIGHQIALGLAAAHHQGLIHRDVKPANILLENGIERVRITDFGLARTAGDASISRSGEVSGTPAFMSPEQAEGKPLDSRSDLFSLGSVLYAMCAGHPPFRAESAMAVLRRVCDEAPVPLTEVNPAVPKWLAATVARLQARNPADRFASASEVAHLLSQQLAQLQSGLEPTGVTSGRTRQRYRLRGAVLAILLVAAIATAWYITKDRTGERESAKDHPSSNSPEPTLPTEPIALKPAKTLTGHVGGVYVVAFSPDGKLLASGGEDRTIRLWDMVTGTSRSLQTDHPDTVVGLAFSPDGTMLASTTGGSDSCRVRLWKVATGKPEGTLGEAGTGMWAAVWSPDGTRIAAAGWDSTLRIWDVASREERLSVPNICTRFARGLAFSPKGEWIVTGGSGPTRLWDAKTGDEVATEPMPEMCPTFLSTGGIAGWVHGAGRVVTCDVPSGKVRVAWQAHRGLIEGLAVSPDGRFVASFDPEGTARVWYIAGTESVEVATLTGHRGSVYFASFTPDGTQLATAGKDDFTVRLWDLPAICHVHKP
jgi:serine/threonine protein kinase